MVHKVASLKYATMNLGDQIQSIATELHLPSVSALLERDNLKSVILDEQHLLVMNGWFSHNLDSVFPLPECITPVFFGFHITDWNDSYEKLMSKGNLEFLRQRKMVGCRDIATTERLKSLGINSFFSNCLTTTFSKREKQPVNGKIFIVDADHVPLPGVVRKGVIRLSHAVSPFFSEELKRDMAQELLKNYRDYASLVITTRLHCALPCIAMGIPVVFFGNPEDIRFSSLQALGCQVNQLPDISGRGVFNRLKYKRYIKSIDWCPDVLDIEKHKSDLIDNFNQNIETLL